MTNQHEKKNTAQKIDGSIDKAGQTFDNKVNEGINKVEGFIAKHARAYNLSGNVVKIGAVVIALIGVNNVYSAVVIFSMRYYPMNTWIQFIFGALLICIAIAAWRASKQLDGTRPPIPAKKPAAKAAAEQPAAAPEEKEAAETAKRRDIWWWAYAASAALAVFIMMKPATNSLVAALHGSGALFAWGWIVGMAAYAWYRFQGGKWTLSINGFPLTFLIVLIDIGLVFVLFA